MTLCKWLSENPKAEHAMYLAIDDGMSSRELLAHLKENYRFPFKNHTVLWTLMRARFRGKKVREQFQHTKKAVRAIERHRDFFITCAVSQPTQRMADDSLDLPAYISLRKAAEHCGGRVFVGCTRYKNPTYRGQACQNEVWPELLKEDGVIVENEMRPHQFLTVLNTKIQATADNPIPRSMYRLTGPRSAILCHPQLALRSCPVNHGPSKMIYSSGAITRPTGSTTLQGAVAEHDHRVAAIKVEIRGAKFHMREIVWDGEKWLDLGRAYTPQGVKRAPQPIGLSEGDLHFPIHDPEVDDALWGPGGLVDVLRPKEVFHNDSWNGREVSRHTAHDVVEAMLMAHNRVEDGIRELARYWEERMARYPEIIHWENLSNHDAWLDGWVRGGKCAPKDLEFFGWLTWQYAKAAREGRDPLALELAMEYVDAKVHPRFAKERDSRILAGVQMIKHGHQGPNGARGSMANMILDAQAAVYEHTHGPGIWKHTWWGGHSSRSRHGYNTGASNWHKTSVLLHANGIPQMLHFVGGEVTS